MAHSKSFKQVNPFESKQTEMKAQPALIDWKLVCALSEKERRKFAMSGDFQKKRHWCRIQIPGREYVGFLHCFFF